MARTTRPCTSCNGGCTSQRDDARPVVHGQWEYRGDAWTLELTMDAPKETRVYDGEWDYRFTLPGHVLPDLVEAVLEIEREARERGELSGEEQAKAHLRRWLGVAPLPKDED